MISLEEARANIGRAVVYVAFPHRPEDGVIERVGREYIFVKYDDHSVKATHPRDLEFSHGE